jgi:hypothetical protein
MLTPLLICFLTTQFFWHKLRWQGCHVNTSTSGNKRSDNIMRMRQTAKQENGFIPDFQSYNFFPSDLLQPNQVAITSQRLRQASEPGILDYSNDFSLLGLR